MIELRAHNCIPTDRWQAIRPKLKQAATLAIETAAEYGMQLTDPKYNQYHAVPSRYRWLGEARTTKTNHFFLKPGMVNGHIDVGYMACKNLHELAHQFREELVGFETVGEWAATEGIAHNLDYLSRRQSFISTWNYPQTPVVSLVCQASDREKKVIYDELAEDMYKPLDDVMVTKWGRIEKRRGIRAIDIVGIAAVNSQLQQGYQMTDIWQLPALEALGYEEVYETAA